MSTFSQWWTLWNKSEKVHEHYYVCGGERVLVEETINLIKQKLNVKPWNFNTFVVGVDHEDNIWESLYSSSVDGEQSLTVIHDFDQLTKLELLSGVLTSKSSKHIVILTTKESKVPRYRTEMEDGKYKNLLPTHLENFEKKGKIVECIPFSQTTAKTAVAWVKTKVDAKEGALVHLLNESNGNLKTVRDVLRKLKWLQEPASMRNVNVFLETETTDDFSSALIALDKKAAIRAIQNIPSSEVLQVIGKLDAQVDLAGRVHDMMSRKLTVPAIMKEIGPQAFLVPEISKIAKYYTKDRRMSIRTLLSEADKRLRRGINNSVLEVLVLMW